MHSILNFIVLALVWTIAVSLPVGDVVESVDPVNIANAQVAPDRGTAPVAPIAGNAPVAPIAGNAPADLDTANTFGLFGLGWGGWGGGWGYNGWGRNYGGYYNRYPYYGGGGYYW